MNEKTRKIIWVLGWILMFPIPLTILLLRRRNTLKPTILYGGIAAAWIAYLAIGLFGGRGSNDTSSTRYVTNTPETVQEHVVDSRVTEEPVREETESVSVEEQVAEETHTEEVVPESNEIEIVEEPTETSEPTVTPEALEQIEEEPAEVVQPTEAPKPVPVTKDYVCNVNSKKFHIPSCRSVKDMKEENKLYVTCTRDELIAQGYEPCGTCHP